MAGPAHPFPQLKEYSTTSGLHFAWAEYNPHTESSSSAHLGPDGVGAGMQMLIAWDDLKEALGQLLGYARRDYETGTGPALKRVLPWQHPYYNNLWVKAITQVKGIRMEGTNFLRGDTGPKSGVGAGFTPNTGPWTDYNLALLTIQFWRPPYYIRTDADIFGQEWLRFVDKHWTIETEMLSREGSTFAFVPGQGLPTGKLFPGSVGQKVCHVGLKRTWYQVPEACIFSPIDGVATVGGGQIQVAQGTVLLPVGIPGPLIFTQTPASNIIVPSYTYPAGSTLPGCVNGPIGGGSDDSNPATRFFGFPAGTLLYIGAEITPRDLQLPAGLMSIPTFGITNEPISQVQYDVTFHFDYFDPARAASDLVGQVLSVTVLDPGSGYTDGTYSVNFTSSSGSGAVGSAIVSGGKVLRIVMTDGGSGYTSPPVVTLVAPNSDPADFEANIITSVPSASYRGHNLFPYSGNGFWYAVTAQQAPYTTAFHYADFSDLFQVI